MFSDTKRKEKRTCERDGTKCARWRQYCLCARIYIGKFSHYLSLPVSGRIFSAGKMMIIWCETFKKLVCSGTGNQIYICIIIYTLKFKTFLVDITTSYHTIATRMITNTISDLTSSNINIQICRLTKEKFRGKKNQI